MKHLPIFVALEAESVLVVGGGEVAARKIAMLARTGARITVVAPALCPELASAAAGGRLEHHCRPFRDSDIEQRRLVYSATDDAAVNRRVSALCQARNIPVNVVDDPALCSFITPSIVYRDPVQIAVSTGGASPVLARLLRARLETMVPASYGELARLMSRFRERVQARLPEGPARRGFWERVLQGPVAELLFAGRREAASAAMEAALDREGGVDSLPGGEVYLVGSGPGDPDLLSFRALRLMQQADVVVYDRLVPEGILELVRRDAERVYVGKERDRHTLPQQDINALLVARAREGLRVLRLKGGDPFIFGRGGEEIDTLSAEGIAFQVVPGITAAAGCAAYAGIPLTHRDYAQSCVFVTGHMKDGHLRLDWEALARPRQTVVVYMGVQSIDTICRELIAHGRAADTPAAVVQQGTTPAQRTLTGTLQDLPERVARAAIQPPSLIIVGEVVALHAKLAWFSERAAESETQALAVDSPA